MKHTLKLVLWTIAGIILPLICITFNVPNHKLGWSITLAVTAANILGYCEGRLAEGTWVFNYNKQTIIQPVTKDDTTT